MNGRRRFATCISLFVASSLATSLCLAEPADEEEARALFRQGVALQDGGNPAAALEKYDAAYALWKNPKIQANLGAAYAELHRPLDAARAYDRFLDATPRGTEGRHATEAALADAARRIGTLSIVANTQLASVRVDGELVEEHFERVRVLPGAHMIQATALDGREVTREATIAAGMTESVLLHFAGPTESPAASPAPARDEPERDASAGPSPGALPWIIGGVGVASLLASGGFYLVRASAISDLEGRCVGDVCPGSDQSTIDRANLFGVLSGVALGVGVVGIGTGIVLLTTDGANEEASPSAAVGVTVSGGGPMMSATGRF